MKYIVEVNNNQGAFEIILFDTQSAALDFIAAINKNTHLTAYDRGTTNN